MPKGGGTRADNTRDKRGEKERIRTDLTKPRRQIQGTGGGGWDTETSSAAAAAAVFLVLDTKLGFLWTAVQISILTPRFQQTQAGRNNGHHQQQHIRPYHPAERTLTLPFPLLGDLKNSRKKISAASSSSSIPVSHLCTRQTLTHTRDAPHGTPFAATTSQRFSPTRSPPPSETRKLSLQYSAGHHTAYRISTTTRRKKKQAKKKTYA